MINRKISFLFYLFIISAISYAQNNEVSGSAAYLIPRQIFVGDPATLVLPLPQAEQNKPDIVITSPSEYLPSDPNIDFHRIILERRTVGSRLLIEFTPFVPGILEFPVIEIEDEYFTELFINVNSLIDEKVSPVLSGAASALAIPGTALMLYGSLTAVVVVLLLVFLFLVKGRTFLRKFIEKWKRRALFGAMRKTAKRLHKEIFKGSDKRIILDKLSDEFRSFLSDLTGNNCRAMTAGEFENIHASFAKQEEDESSLVTFFRSCDELRFSGESINSNDLFGMLDDMKHFLAVMESAELPTKLSAEKNEQKEKTP